MVIRFSSAILAAAAAAVISAPVAGAASTPECSDNGPASVCSRNGHAAIFAEPRQFSSTVLIAPGGPFGTGQTPPLLAMD